MLAKLAVWPPSLRPAVYAGPTAPDETAITAPQSLRRSAPFVVCTAQRPLPKGRQAEVALSPRAAPHRRKSVVTRPTTGRVQTALVARRGRVRLAAFPRTLALVAASPPVVTRPFAQDSQDIGPL